MTMEATVGSQARNGPVPSPRQEAGAEPQLHPAEDVALAAQALMQALTPQAVARLAGLASALLALADELARGDEAWAMPLLRSLEQASHETRQRGHGPARWAELWRMARHSDTLRGLYFLLAAARALGRALAEPGEPVEEPQGSADRP
ncbi:MAG TPA: hypothetical protein VIL11_05450 [Limnochordales bacterium]